MKKKFLIVLTIFISLFMLTSCSSDSNPYDSNNVSYEHEYAITSLSVDVKVNKDRSARVTEKYEVYYKVRSLGISRYLPYKNGELYRDIEVNGDQWFLTDEGSYFAVNTGARDYSGNSYSAGSHKKYEISYTIIPPTKTRNATNYYMNVVGHGWSTSQSNVSITMEFPYKIKSAIAYYGGYGSTNSVSPSNGTGSSEVTLLVSENSLTITAKKLGAYEGITVKADLGKRFGVYIDYVSLVIIILMVIGLVSVILIRMHKFTENPITPVVNFYPPKKDGRPLTPAEAGYLVDGTSDDEDITSMVFYFASKGYLKIKNEGGETKLLRLVNALPSTEPEHSETIFNGLFLSGSEVTVEDLSEKFYVTLYKAKVSVSKDYKGKLFKNRTKGWVIAVVAAIASVLSAFVMLWSLAFRLEGILICGAVAPLVSFVLVRVAVMKKHKLTAKAYKKSLGLALVVGIAISMIAALFVLNGITYYYIRVLIYAIPMLIGFFAGFCLLRTDFYTEELNQLLGFKDFLQCAEKERLETLIEENPEYYYDILPYANVLGVSDKWMEKFEGLTVQPPSYYEYSDPLFDILLFNTFYRTSFASIRTAARVRPSNGMSSGGFGGGGFGGGGGGFSGGGFGGGGGGRR